MEKQTEDMLTTLADPDSMMGIVLSEEAYTFVLTFKSYNNATLNGREVLVDKVIEGDFRRMRKVSIEFMTPVYLTQKFE